MTLADILQGKTATADVMFLVAMVMFIVALVYELLETHNVPSALLYGGLACLALGLLVL